MRSVTEEFPFFSRVMFLVISSSVGLGIHRSKRRVSTVTSRGNSGNRSLREWDKRDRSWSQVVPT
jgi:hypothetical protein